MRHLSLPSSRLLIASLCFLLVASSNQSLRYNQGSKLILSAHNRILDSAHGHTEKHVDADDHKHALEIHACEGTELELHGDAILSAQNIDNVKQYLVTNEELTSCDEIEALRCKPGASFCKVWSANYNQNVELKANMFKNKKAYFYVQPENKDYVMSTVIKLHPEGYQEPHSSTTHSAHKEEHVHDDSEYHSLEIKDCTGVTLDLPENQDALFDTSSVSNAKRFMITDIELESCDEIKRLMCKPGHQVCHIWDAHANEMVVLHKEQYKNKQAFFYVEAQNEQASVSVNIKVVPAYVDKDGNYHAVNDPHPEGHIGPRNGSHTEKHIDPTGQIHAVELKACTGTTIEMHGDVFVSAQNVYNGKRYMVTNIEMQTCEQIAAFECQKEATFCHIWNANSNETFVLKYNLFANHEAFFYADPIDHNQEVSLNLKVTPEGDQHGHIPRHTGVEEVRLTIDGHHHGLELHQCTAVVLGLKGETVLEIENIDNAHSFMITDVPMETCGQIVKWGCSSDANHCHIWEADHKEDVLLHAEDFHEGEAFLYVRPIDKRQAMSINARLMRPDDLAPGTKPIDIFIPKEHQHLMIYTILTVFVLLLITSYCYRRYMSRYKAAMFNAPFWCPSCLFPQYDPESHENFITSESRRQDTKELETGINRQVDI